MNFLGKLHRLKICNSNQVHPNSERKEGRKNKRKKDRKFSSLYVDPSLQYIHVHMLTVLNMDRYSIRFGKETKEG